MLRLPQILFMFPIGATLKKLKNEIETYATEFKITHFRGSIAKR